jgi:hypothetical protein
MKKEYPWINHDGSNNIPCLPETLIDVLFRDGTICQNVFANKWYWSWDNQTLADDDVIAWKYNHNHKNQIKTIEINFFIIYFPFSQFTILSFYIHNYRFYRSFGIKFLYI